MKINIIVVGKAKNKYKEDLNYYLKQIPIKVEIIEVLDEPNESGMEIEGDRVLKKIVKDSYVIALAINGKKLDSISFSQRLEELIFLEKKMITFIIGGSYGLAEKVIKRADELLSFSDFTFPHVLMRLILVEQIYRGFKIIEKHPYHK